jgi:hypothetical protein
LTDYKSKEFSFLLRNRDEFTKKYTKDSVNNKIHGVYLNGCYNLIDLTNADSAKYFSLKEEIQKSGFAKGQEIISFSDIHYYETKHNLGKYAQSVVSYIETYQSNNAGVLNDFAYAFYANIKDKAMLSKAEQWAKKGYELNPDPQITMDTYACILSVNGKKEEAVKLEKQAMEQIKSDPKKYDQNAIPDMEKKISDWSAK